MSGSKKILINGCGYTFWKQAKHKTWAKIFHLLPCCVVDISGPAVSNQWILDQTFFSLLEDDSITDVVLQLTSIGKLDVEVNDDRMQMINDDALRNFIFQGIWPSSHSLDHESKRLWKKYLWSPKLEINELCTKIMLLKDWCETHQKNFLCYQAYDIKWTDQQRKYLDNCIQNIDSPWNRIYQNSSYYHQHDHSGLNTVPCWAYHIELAKIVASDLGLNISSILEKIK